MGGTGCSRADGVALRRGGGLPPEDRCNSSVSTQARRCPLPLMVVPAPLRETDKLTEQPAVTKSLRNNTQQTRPLDNAATVPLVSTFRRFEAKVKPNAARPNGTGPDGFVRAT